MKKRLKGRGITLLGQVKSKVSGRNNFECSNGHVWRTKPLHVAQGEGCPECGMGQRTLAQMDLATTAGVLCLLQHADKPGIVKIGLVHKALDQFLTDNDWPGWTLHRYRTVDEPTLAEKLIWELLGHPRPDDCEIRVDLDIAERAFRKINYRLDEEIALAEKAKELS